MESVMISIKPKWCELIANGKKTFEVRKTKPKIDTPFKCYIYCTKRGMPLVLGSHIPSYIEENLAQTRGFSREKAEEVFGCWNGNVIGEFVCDEIYIRTLSNLLVKEDAEKSLHGTCLSNKEVLEYLGYKKDTSLFDCKHYGFFCWHISELKIYDKPKDIGKFNKNDVTRRPPQSWCYLKNMRTNNA